MKVTIIGGGSYQWSPKLMADLLGTPSLAGVEIALMDIDPAPLPRMEALFHKLDDALGARATVTTTTDRRRALEGADFVVVTISTGGFASMAVDIDVPAKYGIRQSVGDTVGPGGINRSLRNVPVLASIAGDVHELCPDAWLLNITNPLTCLTRAAHVEAPVKAIGLCHEVGNFCLDLAIALGLPGEAVRPTVAGVNHFPIITELRIAGADGFEVLAELVADLGGADRLVAPPGAPPAEPFSKLDFARRHPLSLSLLDRFGALPAAGDRHVAEFVPWVLTEESGWGEAWGIELTPISVREEHQAGFVADVEGWLAGTKPLETWASGEMVAPVIDSILTGTRRELPLNLPNDGQCADLRPGAVVESMCVVDGDGVRGRDAATVPEPFASLLQRHVAVQELAVRAALDGDRRLALTAVALDPLAGRGDLRAIEAMVDDLIAGTAAWLPQFAGC